jgi:hypothetical protein
MKIEVIGCPCGIAPNVPITAALVVPKNGGTPSAGAFTAGFGGIYDPQQGWTMAEFIPASLGNNYTCNRRQFRWYSTLGMICDFLPNTTTILRNGPYFCVSNQTGTAVLNQDCTISISFYDV